MKTIVALRHLARSATGSALAVALSLAFGLQTAHATIATNFTIVNHSNGGPLSLHDYQGSVILLDFWAYWCEYCQAAASDIEPNITRFYRAAGGNSNGVPVTVISISIDCSDMSLEDAYIQTYGLELVGDDCNWVAFDQFSSYGGGGIPQFVVINGTTNSLNYAPWQIVAAPDGYATNYTVPLLKSYIDSVQTPAPVCSLTNPLSGAIVPPPTVALGANVTTKGKIIKKLEFYNGTTLLGSTTNPPYTMIWSNVPVGSKSVVTSIHYGTSFSVSSSAVTFTVAEPVMASLSAQGANLLLSWTGGAGNFQVQVATNLAGAGCWQNCGAAGTNTSIVITPGNPAAFYRLKWP
jgi:thiol-disulfide isomerase/thioredoxin